MKTKKKTEKKHNFPCNQPSPSSSTNVVFTTSRCSCGEIFEKRRHASTLRHGASSLDNVELVLYHYSLLWADFVPVYVCFVLCISSVSLGLVQSSWLGINRNHELLRHIHIAIEPDLDWICFDWSNFQSSSIRSALWFCNVNPVNEMWAHPWLSLVIIIWSLIHWNTHALLVAVALAALHDTTSNTVKTVETAEKVVVIADETEELLE